MNAEPSESQRAEIQPTELGIGGLGRGMVWRYLQLLVTAGASLFITSFSVRRLGVDDFGIFALVASISSILGFVDFALSFTVVRASAVEDAARTATERGTAQSDIRAAHAAYVALGAGIAITVMGLAGILPGIFPASNSSESEVRATVLLVGFSVAVMVATSALYGIAYGRRQFAALSAAAVGGAAANVCVIVFSIERYRLVALGLGHMAAILANRLILASLFARRVPWFKLRPIRPTWREVRRVLQFAFPLLIISIGSQIVASTDIIILGALTSAASVGLYRVGSLLPYQAVSVLYQGYDVVFPLLATTDSLDLQLRATTFLTRVASYVGAVGFGLIAFFRNDIVLLMTEHPSDLAADVLLIFCAVWLANVTIHGLALLVIAQGRHRVIARLVLLEIAVNLFLTFALVPLIGAVGAALASLIAVILSNCILLPWQLKRAVSSSAARLVVRHGLLPAIVGIAIITVPCAAALISFRPSLARLLLGGAPAIVVAAVSGSLLLGHEGRQQLLTMLRKASVEK